MKNQIAFACILLTGALLFATPTLAAASPAGEAPAYTAAVPVGWDFVCVETPDGQRYLPDDIALDYLLWIDGTAGTLIVTNAGVETTFPVLCEETVREDGTWMLLVRILSPEDPETVIDAWEFVRDEQLGICRCIYREDGTLDAVYRFIPMPAGGVGE